MLCAEPDNCTRSRMPTYEYIVADIWRANFSLRLKRNNTGGKRNEDVIFKRRINQ